MAHNERADVLIAEVNTDMVAALIAGLFIFGSQDLGSDADRMRAARLLLAGDIATLVDDTRSGNFFRKRNAIWALGNAGDIGLLPVILEAHSPETSGAVENAIHALGIPAYRALLNMALHGPRERRRSAASLLLSLAIDTHGPKPNKARPLLQNLRNSDDAELRYYALFGYKDEDPATKWAVFTSYLDDPNARNRRLAIQRLAQTPDRPSMASLLAKIVISDKDAGVRATALGTFIWYGGLALRASATEQFAAIMHALQDEPIVAKQALLKVIWITGLAGRSTARSIIENQPENAETIRAAQRVWDSDALRNCVYAWLDADDKLIRLFAVEALAALRDPRAVDAILAWDTEAEWDRFRMLQALGWTDDQRAIAMLWAAATLPTITDGEREAIAKGLAMLDAPGSAAFATALLLDRSVHPNHRTGAIREVASFDEAFAETVFSVVRDVSDSSQVRGNLLYVLPRLDPGRAFDVAVWILGRNEDSRMHWQAVATLEKIGDRRAIPYIEKALEGTTDETLKRVGERAIESLKGG